MDVDPVVIAAFSLSSIFALVLITAYILSDRLERSSTSIWVDEVQQVPIGPGKAELINFTDVRNVSRHRTDTTYDPRGNADAQDSVEIDTRRRERIHAVVTGSMTHEAKPPTQSSAATTRAMPRLATEHRHDGIDEKRKTRLRELLRDTQSSR